MPTICMRKVRLEDEELKLDCEGAQTMEDPDQKFVTLSEVQAIIPAEMEKSTFHRSGAVFLGLL